LRDACVAAHQPGWPVTVLCEVLEVGRSGFYDDQTRQAAPALSPEEIDLRERIKALSAKTQHSDGSRRLVKPLQDEG
jgi:hypothetical protein